MVLEGEFRTIKARGYYLSDEELDKYQIRRVYNSSGTVEFMRDDSVRRDVQAVVRGDRGEVALVEFSISNSALMKYRLKTASIIVFRGLAGLNMFVLANQELYGSVGVANVIMN